MTLEVLPCPLSVCKLTDAGSIPAAAVPCFIARTDGELSLVCPTVDVPADCVNRSDGWRAFRVRGPLDFSLVGILARLSGLLAGANIPLFAISTFDTDYLLVREADLSRALEVLVCAGCSVAR